MRRRATAVLAPAGARGDDAEALARLLELALALGDAGEGGGPIRQLWLDNDLRFEGKLGAPLSPPHADEAERIAGRILREWGRFLASAFARLRGEERGSAHFRFPDGGWDAGAPTTIVTAWPPLEGEALPALE